MSLHRTLRRFALTSLTTVAVVAAAPAGASACDRVAAPGGSNTAAGTEAAPYATFQKLADSLAPGQVGCLRGGTYSEQTVTLNRGGTGEDARVVIKSFPGERAKHVGRLYVPDRANFVTVEQLDLDGSTAERCPSGATCNRLPSPTVNGDDIVFQDNDVTNQHQAICFNLGNSSYGTARRVLIRRNRIHNCGILPANNHDHGIYLTETEDVRILDNVIYDNADRGIQMYPNADRTVIRGNIIDGNGQGIIFSGVGDSVSSDNVVENNIVTNAKLRYNIESWYPDLIGTGNVARDNCVYGGERGDVSSQVGFVATRNLVADPLYVDRAGKDFRLRSGSPCADILAGGQAPAAPAPSGSGTIGGDSGSGSTSGGDLDAGTGSGADTSDQEGKPGDVVLENVSVKKSKRSKTLRLRVAGRLTGWGADALLIQVRQSGRWKTIRTVRNVRKIFRATVRAPRHALRASSRMTVRVVIPGGDASDAVRARVRR
ncbi:MAG: right-handed parallel beta-helix repeat-containing protein [Actinomycetota bacterium]|nr:right-handed parallel beta-helix repeat-containing protein [Actinomycetota bacterium]